MKKEETKEIENQFNMDGNLIDLDKLPDTNIVSLMNDLRNAKIKIETWMPAAIGICNSIALQQKLSLKDLRKVNKFIVGKMVKSDKELTGNDYLKAFEKIMAKYGIMIKLGDVEYTAKEIIK